MVNKDATTFGDAGQKLHIVRWAAHAIVDDVGPLRRPCITLPEFRLRFLNIRK